MPTIRDERSADRDAVADVHRQAFPTEAEARLVDALRTAGKAAVSLVAEQDGRVVGHILFSPVTVAGPTPAAGLGLAPVAVLPAYQRQGVGSALIRAGLDRCRADGCPFVVVLGHVDYYPRFGFRRAGPLGLGNEYGAGDAFQVVELRPGGLSGVAGLVRYAEEFSRPWP